MCNTLIISKILKLKKALFITVADNVFCDNFLHFGHKETAGNYLKLIEKQNIFYLIVVTF